MALPFTNIDILPDFARSTRLKNSKPALSTPSTSIAGDTFDTRGAARRVAANQNAANQEQAAAIGRLKSKINIPVQPENIKPPTTILPGAFDNIRASRNRLNTGAPTREIPELLFRAVSETQPVQEQPNIRVETPIEPQITAKAGTDKPGLFRAAIATQNAINLNQIANEDTKLQLNGTSSLVYDDLHNQHISHSIVQSTLSGSGPTPPEPPVILDLSIEPFESYSLGPIADASTLTGGTGWGTITVIEQPYMVIETFETYADGSVGDGSGLTGGIHWSGPPIIN
jgi:hypothetical protein